MTTEPDPVTKARVETYVINNVGESEVHIFVGYEKQALVFTGIDNAEDLSVLFETLHDSSVKALAIMQVLTQFTDALRAIHQQGDGS